VTHGGYRVHNETIGDDEAAIYRDMRCCRAGTTMGLKKSESSPRATSRGTLIETSAIGR